MHLDGIGPLRESELIQRQVDGRVATRSVAKTGLDALRASDLITASDEPEDHTLALTAAGEAAFAPARRAVSQITEDLHRNLPPADLEATRRTLAEVAARANQKLAAPTR